VNLTSAQTLSDGNNGIPTIDALNNGFHLAFITAAVVAAISAIVAVVAIKKPNAEGGKKEEEEKKEVIVSPED
jgi:phosphotransferase system  glucose/maltose/N-acetylglucosamine-specific IIC component